MGLGSGRPQGSRYCWRVATAVCLSQQHKSRRSMCGSRTNAARRGRGGRGEAGEGGREGRTLSFMTSAQSAFAAAAPATAAANHTDPASGAAK